MPTTPVIIARSPVSKPWPVTVSCTGLDCVAALIALPVAMQVMPRLISHTVPFRSATPHGWPLWVVLANGTPEPASGIAG